MVEIDVEVFEYVNVERLNLYRLNVLIFIQKMNADSWLESNRVYDVSTTFSGL